MFFDRKTGKREKVGVKRNWWVLAQPPIPRKKTEGSHPGWNHGTRGIDHQMQKITQGTGIVKGWEDKRDRVRIPDKFT